jgi:hypothetical protein
MCIESFVTADSSDISNITIFFQNMCPFKLKFADISLQKKKYTELFKHPGTQRAGSGPGEKKFSDPPPPRSQQGRIG